MVSEAPVPLVPAAVSRTSLTLAASSATVAMPGVRDVRATSWLTVSETIRLDGALRFTPKGGK
jgi:hypothetical protein